MPVTFQVVGNLADFGNDPRPGVRVRATATPRIKVSDVSVHSNEPETVLTDETGAFVLTLVSLPGVWYRIQTPYANAISTVNLAGYVPDVDDTATGEAFPADTVINLIDVVSEDPTPGYEAIAIYPGGDPAALAAIDARLDALEDAPGGSGGTVTADDTPAAPAEGQSATYFVTSAVTWPVGLVWSTDPDGDVAPTIVEAALVSMFTLDGLTYAVLGATFPAPVIPDTTAPSVPTGLTAVAASHTTVDLSWTASTDAVGVIGYEYRVNGGTAIAGEGAGTTETVSGLTPSTAYDFEVRAYDAAGNFSGWSTVATETTDAAPDVTAPTTPTGLTATAASSTSVDLAWTASTDAVGVTGYEYRIDGGTPVDAGAGLAETVSGLTGATEYDFEVRAYDAAGNRSGWSTVATETTDTPADVTPPTVGTLAGSAETTDGFTLTVTGAADETALNASPYRFSTDNGATYSAYQSSAVYVVTGLTDGTAYTCKHQTRDAAGNVSTGTGVVVTTDAAVSALASDDFNRANGALGTSSGGQAWVNGSIAPTILTNRARGGGSNSRAAINVGQADHKVTVTLATGSTEPAGVLLRGNADLTVYWRVIWFTDGNWYITTANPAVSHRHTWVQAAPAVGDTITAQAVTSGANVVFTVWHNGALIKTYTETNGTYTAMTGNYAGIWGSGVNTYLDDYLCEAP